MAYLYGDSTPFPLNDNFIEVLRKTVSTCISLLKAEEAIERLRAQTEVEKANAERDLAGVERIGAALSRALAPQQAEAEGPYVAEVLSRLMGSVRSVCDGSARDVVNRRDSAMLQVESRIAAERARLPQALETLLLERELPETQWSLNWVVRGGAQPGPGQPQANGWALARTVMGLEATFELDLNNVHPWNAPFRVSEFKPEIVIQLPRKGRWLDKGPSLREERLDRHFITEVSMTPSRLALVLRKALKPGSPGLEVIIGSDSEGQQATGPTIRALDDPSAPEEVVALEGLDAAVVEGLWESVAARLRPLITRRVRLVQALVEGTPVTDLQSPGQVARMLISAIAPYAREMGRRSSVAGELVLKREVENGRREELFISIGELTQQMAALPQDKQAYFEELGLVYDIVGEETEGHTGELDLSADKGFRPASVSATATGPMPAHD